MYKRKMFQAPLCWSDKDDRRRVAWHELFYDLFFVSIIFQLSHSIIYIQSFEELSSFIIAFIAAWWIWSGLTHYYKRFETYGLEKRIGTFVMMIPTAGLAVYAPDMLGGNYIPFVISFIVAQMCLLTLWIFAKKFNPQYRKVARIIIRGFIIVIILAIISLFIEDILIRNIIFFTALFVEIITPAITLKSQRTLYKLHANSKLPERYGLFTLIVIGETIASSVSIAQSQSFNIYSLVVALLGIAIGFSLWWIYHDFITRRLPHPKPMWSFLWGYAHLPLVIFLSFMGVGLSRLSEFKVDTIQSISLTHLFIIISVAGSLITIGCIEPMLQRSSNEPSHSVYSPALKIISGILVLLIGLFMIYYLYSTISIFVMLVLFLMIQMFYSAFTWFNVPIENENDFVGQVVLLDVYSEK